MEPGIVQGAKIVLSYGTATVSFGIAAKLALESIKTSKALPMIVKTMITSLLVLMFFEVFPHQPVGISEVHFILGSTLFLIFGATPASTANGGSWGSYKAECFFNRDTGVSCLWLGLNRDYWWITNRNTEHSTSLEPAAADSCNIFYINFYNSCLVK
jgi:hypothetical protein